MERLYPSRTIEDITRFLFVGSQEKDLKKYDMVLVLGNDFIEGTVDILYRLWKNNVILHDAKIILSGNVGSLDQGKLPEAQRLYECAIEKYSMPSNLFTLETHAANAYENFHFSKSKIVELGGFEAFTSILCIGKAFLLRRATMYASHEGYPQEKMDYFGTVDCEGRNIGPDSWWKSEESIKRVLEEIQRIAVYALKGDLSLF